MEIVTLDASLGKLYGELTLPENVDRPPLVIMSHGFGGDHTGHGDYAAYFNSVGLATFSFDFCGGGHNSRSAGDMTRMSVLTEARDLLTILDRFSPDGRFGGIFIWGQSQGGFVSTYVAGVRGGGIKAAVLEYPAYVLQDDAREVQLEDGSFPETYMALGTLIGRVYGEDATSFDIYDVMRGYSGDVLILHGDEDALVPIKYSRRAAMTLDNAELIVMPGQNHGFSGESRLYAMQAEAEFILRHAH